MDLPPFDNSAATPATRKPGVAITFGSGNDTGSDGLLGAVSSVATAMGVSVAGGATDPWQRGLVEIICESKLAPAVDCLKIQIAQDSMSPAYDLEDKGDVRLGYEDDQLYPVFTGTITRIQTSLQNHATLTVCNASHALARMRLNENFEKQTAGDIVESLAGAAGVDTDSVEDGLEFPFYVIDDGKNLYQHIAELAQKSGLIAYMGADGKLNFTSPPSGEPVKIFNYGVDIVSLKTMRSGHKVNQVTVIGQGAAGSQGADTWNWLVKDPQAVTAEAGDGDNVRLIPDHALRSGEAVQQSAAGRLFFLKQQSHKAHLTVLGAAEVLAGGRIEIRGAPNDALNGTAMVETVRHQYNKSFGFTSELNVFMESADNGLDLLGALGGLF